ncbi:hypothetical protein HY490_01355 [Candidatus Woesearchaeota archaeon]|nr:hypothetical protein [Candidatus Woesearchaeota archaeon]
MLDRHTTQALGEFIRERATQDSCAASMFQEHELAVQERFQTARRTVQWSERIHDAEVLLAESTKPGRTPAYTPEGLAEEILRKQVVETHHAEHVAELQGLAAVHDAVIRYKVQNSGLADILKQEGARGNKLVVVELSARISPALTFAGSSNYLTAVLIPYGREARIALGENFAESSQFVSQSTAIASAENASRRFQTRRVLAETSAAPRPEIVKSGRKPEVYVCTLVNDVAQTPDVSHHVIDTLFREKFDCVVREIMYSSLKKLYGVA